MTAIERIKAMEAAGGTMESRWKAAQEQACREGRPHYRRLVEPRRNSRGTGEPVLAEVPPCDHPFPDGVVRG